jgi:nucleotide-binding universal stress UspA family protein
MKVLLGIDDSASSAVLVSTVVKQFRCEDAEVRVLNVLQPIALTAPPEMARGYAPELEELRKPAREMVERIAKELQDSGFKANAVVAVGDVREVILASAAEWNADLIVLGSHGERGIQNLLLGSIAEFVASHARCSVQIVRTK